MATHSLPIFKNVVFFHKSELYNFPLLGHGRQSIAHELNRAGGGHVATTHKLLCFFIRIRMFVHINLRHIKYKMTRLVWLAKCPHVPQASPSATNTVNWRNSLDIPFSLRSLSSWGRPRFITTPPSSAKTLTASNLYLKMLPKSRVNRFPRQDFQDQRSMCSDFGKYSMWTTLRHFGKMQIFPPKVAHSPS